VLKSLLRRMSVAMGEVCKYLILRSILLNNIHEQHYHEQYGNKVANSGDLATSLQSIIPLPAMQSPNGYE